MDTNAVILTFTISSFLIALTILAIYTAFGPSSINLIDPFEEDKD